jgi:hypothetical protein
VILVISVYFNLRNILPKSGTFLPGHSVSIYIYNFDFCLITNRLLLDYNLILLVLLKDKIVGYSGNYKKHVLTVFGQNADCIRPKLHKYIM